MNTKIVEVPGDNYVHIGSAVWIEFWAKGPDTIKMCICSECVLNALTKHDNERITPKAYGWHDAKKIKICPTCGKFMEGVVNSNEKGDV